MFLFQSAFQVAGFSVTGQVVDSLKVNIYFTVKKRLNHGKGQGLNHAKQQCGSVIRAFDAYMSVRPEF